MKLAEQWTIQNTYHMLPGCRCCVEQLFPIVLDGEEYTACLECLDGDAFDEALTISVAGAPGPMQSDDLRQLIESAPANSNLRLLIVQARAALVSS